MLKASQPHDFSYLIDALKDPQSVAEYLAEVLKDNDMDLFKQALNNVAKAQGGYTELAKKTGLNRQSLYRALSKNGDPKLSTLTRVLPAFGVSLKIETLKAA